MPRYRFLTFGCKVNQCDTAALAQALHRRGWGEARPGEAPDLVLVNTCTVTARADQQARQAIRRAAREFPAAALWVTGCYAQRAPEELASLPGVVGVAGNFDKPSLPLRLGHAGAPRAASTASPPGGPETDRPDHPPSSFPGRTRALLKVQDGCSHQCSYCIVPQVRGPARSVMTPEAVAAHLRTLGEYGYEEVVLTGVDLGQYGRDRGADLAGLLRHLAARPAPGRLRLSSLEPQEVTPEVLAAWADLPGACPHFHLPLQSGAREVLTAMHRVYSPEDFRELVMALHRRFPTAAIGLDVLAGFPSEREKDFAQTLSLLESLPVAYLHVFPFSPRPGTPAASLRPLPAVEVRARAGLLRKLGRHKRQRFLKAQVGRVEDVLIEGPAPRPGWLRGLTANYVRVILPGPPAWRRRRLPVRLLEPEGGEVLRGKALGVSENHGYGKD